MASEIESAIRQICEEKGLAYEAVIETVEAALAAAYRKDYGNKMQNIEAEFAPETGGVRLFDVKTVVEDLPEEEIEEMRRLQAEELAGQEAETASKKFMTEEDREAEERKREREREQETATAELEEDAGPKFNPKSEMMISDAKVLKRDAEIGDVIRTELPLPGDFGRMAAMTAKQVITQKLREAEREIIFNEYKEQEGEVLIGTVQRREGRVVLVDIGRAVGILLPEDQIPSERYNSGDRIKVFVREVSLGTRGPQILLSRTSEELVRILFEIEIPEIADGIVQIKNIGREAGSRSKVAVYTNDESIDPIGACIGQRGIRIQTIISELGGEKIDVVEWGDDPQTYIIHSLSPAKISDVILNEETKEATVVVPTDQLSLAIGKGGQNVRLAAKLTGWKLSIQDEGAPAESEKEEASEESAEESAKTEKVDSTEEPVEEPAVKEGVQAETLEQARAVAEEEVREDEQEEKEAQPDVE